MGSGSMGSEQHASSTAASANDETCAVVIGATTAGYSIVQELHHYGIRHIALLDRYERGAASSKWIESFDLVDEGGPAMRDALFHIHGRYEKLVIFPTRDDHLEDLEECYDEISAFCHLPFNRPQLRRDLDKIHQYQECERLGVPCPRTTFVREAADLDQLDAMPLPLLIKPQEKTPLARPRLVEHADELPEVKAIIRDHLAQGVQYLASEFVPGDGSNVYAYVGLRTAKGEILNEWIGKKLSQFPNDLGVFASASNQCPEEVLELGRRLIDGMDLHGISEPEFKYDSRDGKYKLMEVNLRSMGWVNVGYLSGVPLHYCLWLHATGQPVPKFEQDRKRDIRFIELENELANLMNRPGYWSVFRSVFGACDQRVFTRTPRDRGPFVDAAKDIAAVIYYHVRKRLTGRERGESQTPGAA